MKLFFQVDGLIPGHEYKFRVKAVNKEGESEPLETFGSIVAKDPFSKSNSFSHSNTDKRKAQINCTCTKVFSARHQTRLWCRIALRVRTHKTNTLP